jgi:hypothetical protein
MSTRVSHPLYRLALALILTLAISLPTTALAAGVPSGPRQTGTAEAELLAYFESDVLPSAETEGVVVGVFFYDDNTFAMTIDLLDGADPSVGAGEYTETDDGVTLSFLVTDGEELDTPVDLDLVWDTDDSLIILGGPDSPISEEDIVLYSVSLESDDAGDDSGMGGAPIGGVYISALQPSAESVGVVYLLNLLPDGTASLNSDYLNLEPPVFEIGAWVDNGDDTVTVEVIGTVDEEYDEPIIIDFAVGADGELIVEGLALYPLSWLSDDGSSDDLGSGDNDVYTFVAEVTLPDESEPLLVYMFLYADGSVALTDAAATGAIYGEWTLEDDTLYITLTRDDEEEFTEPVAMVFEFDADDALVATEYPVEVFGDAGLVFYPADSADAAISAEGEFYYYASDVLPSAETDGIIISLILAGDGPAIIATDYMNDEDPILEYGEWTSDEDGNIVVTITEGPDGEFDEPVVFIFAEDPDDFSLSLTEESAAIFGGAELTLYRVE